MVFWPIRGLYFMSLVTLGNQIGALVNPITYPFKWAPWEVSIFISFEIIQKTSLVNRIAGFGHVTWLPQAWPPFAI